MSDTAPAWLLSVARNIHLCIAEHEAAEYVENPPLHPIPMSPAYCKNTLLWHDRIVPLIDINVLCGNPVKANYQNIIVTAYQAKEHSPLEYVAFVLASPPEKIIVNDDDACELPDDYPDSLTPYILSLFKHNNKLTSIIDIARLGSGSLERLT